MSKPRKANLNVQKWDEWNNALKDIQKELWQIYQAKGIFERINKLLQRRKVERQIHCNPLLLYLHNTYVVYLAIKIRKLVDKQSKRRSIYRLLDEIKGKGINARSLASFNIKKLKRDSTTRITKERKRHYEELADRTFKDKIGGARLTKSVANSDFQKVNDIHKRIGKYISETFAHLGKPTNDVDFDEANKAFDTLVIIFNKYSKLIGGHTFIPDDNVLFNGWDKLL